VTGCSILKNHDQSKPLFLNYDSKLCHYPLQAPQEYQDRFKHIKQDNRRVYHAMVPFKPCLTPFSSVSMLFNPV